MKKKTKLINLFRKLTPHHHWRLSFNKDRESLGSCNLTNKTIYLSKYYLNRIPYEDMEYTLKHEIAHALAGKPDHGDEWKEECRKLGIPAIETY